MGGPGSWKSLCPALGVEDARLPLKAWSKGPDSCAAPPVRACSTAQQVQISMTGCGAANVSLRGKAVAAVPTTCGPRYIKAIQAWCVRRMARRTLRAAAQPAHLLADGRLPRLGRRWLRKLGTILGAVLGVDAARLRGRLGRLPLLLLVAARNGASGLLALLGVGARQQP